MSERVPQSVAKRVSFQAYLTGTTTPATGKTIPITLSKNGGSFANPSVGATNATEIGGGCYYVDLSTTDTGTLGPAIVRGLEGTIAPVFVTFEVTNAHNAGFDGIPAVTAGGTNGLLINGTNTGTVTLAALTVSGATALTGAVTASNAGNSVAVNATKWAGVAVSLSPDSKPLVTCGAFYNAVAVAEYPIAVPLDATTYKLETVGAYAAGKTPLQPTVSGRTLDVTATGAAGIDWANVENPTTTINLSATTIGILAGNTPQTGDSFARIGALGASLTALAPSATALSTVTWTGVLATNLGTLAGHDPGATLASRTNITGGVITTTTNLTNAPTVGDFTATMKTSLSAATPVLSTAGNQAVADATLARNIGGSGNGTHTVGEALAALRNKVTIAGGVLTVYAADGTTTLWSANVTADGTAQPITAVAPTA